LYSSLKEVKPPNPEGKFTPAFAIFVLCFGVI
jgi:hypothetical protein